MSHNKVIVMPFLFQQQATILREDLAGFVFESNRGTKHSFTAETSLGPEFSTGWTGKRGKRLRSKVEQVKQKVRLLWKSFFNCHKIPTMLCSLWRLKMYVATFKSFSLFHV